MLDLHTVEANQIEIQSRFDLTQHSLTLGETVLAQKTKKHRKRLGQFLTPAPVARFMARQLGPIDDGARILDPALGSGTLACAVIEHIIAQGRPIEMWLDGCEVDVDLLAAADEAVTQAVAYAASQGIQVHVRLHKADFILDNIPFTRQLDLFASHKAEARRYDHIIANPPYFKLNRKDPRVEAVNGQLNGHTNIYTLFMALAADLLSADGRACFIVPRSFCSGAYFAAFRRDLLTLVSPEAVHLFESRKDAFKGDEVLQENIIFTFSRRWHDDASTTITVSTSDGVAGLSDAPLSREIALTHFAGRQNGSLYFRLPTGELDELILETIDRWEGSLSRYDLQVSTGPVVPFRAETLLVDNLEQVERRQAVPLLWMQHVKPQEIIWSVADLNKPQAIALADDAEKLLVPAENYVLLRRFSAKEEPRRLIVAPFLVEAYDYSQVGLENHLNYIYRRQGTLDAEETIGLSALLGSALIDRYIRIVSGNTQVNAAELRTLPLPPPNIIREIGRRIRASGPVDIDRVTFSALWDAGYLPPDFPILRETRITMGKIQEAQLILGALGLPAAQQNEISALTLLVLAQLSEDTPWRAAQCRSLRIHDILVEIGQRYGREYAENTRETIRRQVIHQFEQAALVVRNPDDPSLPTNSPKTHYALTDTALETIRSYSTPNWQAAVEDFLASKGALLEVYQRTREQRLIPLRLSDGTEYHLSPGPHNELQAVIVEEFGPRFAPGARVLYLGDTANKTLVFDEPELQALGVQMAAYDKLPDVVLYDEDRNWLFLIEAVTSHGPISPKRQVELEEMFARCTAGVVYVTAFPDFGTFKSFLTEIAWETEVWIAEIPDHLVHFNGDRFLGPRG